MAATAGNHREAEGKRSLEGRRRGKTLFMEVIKIRQVLFISSPHRLRGTKLMLHLTVIIRVRERERERERERWMDALGRRRG